MVNLTDRRQLPIGLASILAAASLSPFATTRDYKWPFGVERAPFPRLFDPSARGRRAPPPGNSALTTG